MEKQVSESKTPKIKLQVSESKTPKIKLYMRDYDDDIATDQPVTRYGCTSAFKGDSCKRCKKKLSLYEVIWCNLDDDTIYCTDCVEIVIAGDAAR